LTKFAIVFSAENQIRPDSNETSSGYEKMAIGLAYSIRACMPEVDIYCGCFTSNTLSDLARHHFIKLNVTLIEDLIFPEVNTKTEICLDNNLNDYYKFNGFLRNFTKDYFAKNLLVKYDYLVYTDIDVLFLKEIQFDFDPMGPMALIEPIPHWSKKLISLFTVKPLSDNLYLNWIDIINNHNKHIYDIDYQLDEIRFDHASDVLITDRLDQSDLTLIEQHLGGYHCYKPPTPDITAYHYDSLGEMGTMFMLESTHPMLYKKYRLLFEKVLDIKIINQPGYWEEVRDRYS